MANSSFSTPQEQGAECVWENEGGQLLRPLSIKRTRLRALRHGVGGKLLLITAAVATVAFASKMVAHNDATFGDMPWNEQLFVVDGASTPWGLLALVGMAVLVRFSDLFLGMHQAKVLIGRTGQ